MDAAALDSQASLLARLQEENAQLRDRLESAEHHTAQTLSRATRLSQVISVLGQDTDFDTVVERAAVEVAELFSADIALLMLGPDDACIVEGQWGVRPTDIPAGSLALEGLDSLTSAEPVLIGAAGEVALPAWLEAYSAQHVAWARLFVAEESLGVMLLVRRGPEPFERSDEKELRAIAYRIALAMENGLLHRQMSDQLARLRRIQEFTTQLAGTLELQAVGKSVAAMLVSEIGVRASVILIDRDGALVPLASHGLTLDHVPNSDESWERFPVETTGKPVGCVDITGAPAPGSEERELLLHLLGLAALALDKALLYDRIHEQARRDSLTGLFGHRVFHEQLEEQTALHVPFSIVYLDIDDFKQINDLYGHQTGDDTLRLVAEALCQGARDRDRVFRVGGEEFCVVLPGVGQEDAYKVAERLRGNVAAIDVPHPVTVSLGVASYPTHAERRDELLASADAALYASKRSGKDRTSIAGAAEAPGAAPADRNVHIALLHDRDPELVAHGGQVAAIAVKIARALGVEDDRLDDLRTAAKLHDIGKVAVPREILDKPGPLDEDELRVVQTHPIVGAELLRAWGFPKPAQLVLEHHEHINGSGYPAGLSGDEITLEARIIHVADAFVAMTLDRPYRKAMRREEALAELERHRGTQFDATVVVALLELEQSRVRAA
jgi:diguanylate cyclase (GGDEF)-like protein/putative nucleotidyltransferase with HDIG domain